MSTPNKLKSIISKVPDSPGVYLMKNAAGEVIYVGKAKLLRKRLNTYLGRDLSAKTAAQMANTEDIEYRLAPTEALALLLEANLIQQYRPKYNISLCDDKSFPLVKITNEEFPALCITRKIEADGARYFGPYTSVGLLREALKIIRRKFPFRTCRKLPKAPCMYSRINLCPAPCAGKISKEEYAKTIENIILILEGRNDVLIKKLSTQMQEKAKAQDFEAAVKLRDQMTALTAIGTTYAGIGSIEELEDLKQLLKLQKLPQRIEAFDISNIFGKEATGSMVSFWRGIPDKDNYRRFRIKTVSGIDDYSMIAEVVKRRYAHLAEENLPLPDLALIDGGRAHLLTALKELKQIGLKIPLASIAKEKENIYIEGQKYPIKLKSDTAALNLVRRIRDEAHRFAVSYHHLLRRKKFIGK